jgi:hypothetical protein
MMAARKKKRPEKKQPEREREKDAAVLAIFETRGRPTAVAKACNVSRQALDNWYRVPAQHVITVSEFVKMTPHEIRPDVFRRPTK